MNRAVVTISAAILALSCVSANSQALTDQGAQTCEKWNDLHQGSPTADTTALDNWVFGYLSGEAKFLDASNRIKGLPPMDILQGIDGKAAVALMSEYCRGNLVRTINEALGELSVGTVAEIVRGRFARRLRAAVPRFILQQLAHARKPRDRPTLPVQ